MLQEGSRVECYIRYALLKNECIRDYHNMSVCRRSASLKTRRYTKQAPNAIMQPHFVINALGNVGRAELSRDASLRLQTREYSS